LAPTPATGENCLHFTILDHLRKFLELYANQYHAPWKYFPCCQILPKPVYAKIKQIWTLCNKIKNRLELRLVTVLTFVISVYSEVCIRESRTCEIEISWTYMSPYQSFETPVYVKGHSLQANRSSNLKRLL
jgi:hypothetical protein